MKQLTKNLNKKQLAKIEEHNLIIDGKIVEKLMCKYCKDAEATNWVHSVEVCSDCFSEVYE